MQLTWLLTLEWNHINASYVQNPMYIVINLKACSIFIFLVILISADILNPVPVESPCLGSTESSIDVIKLAQKRKLPLDFKINNQLEYFFEIFRMNKQVIVDYNIYIAAKNGGTRIPNAYSSFDTIWRNGYNRSTEYL